MKIKIILFILLIVSLFDSFGSSYSKKDSVVNTKTTSDVKNIEILLGLATKVYIQNPERSLQYAETALKIAKENKDQFLQAKTLKVIGDIYRRMDYERL